jgi:hypothetical protein
VFHAPNPGWIPEADLQLNDAISPHQRAKQCGYHTHPAYTYRTAELLGDAMERVWGVRWADQVMGCHMANPSELFRAMDTGDPYPVKAFFSLGNNTLLSYPNQHQIHRALLNQELIVVQDIFMTPTAMQRSRRLRNECGVLVPNRAAKVVRRSASGTWPCHTTEQRWWRRDHCTCAMIVFVRY